MAGYIVVQIAVKDAQQYEQYKQLAADSLAAYGGRYIVRGGAVEALEGSWLPKRLVIIEFPSAERAREWWHSPEYAAGKALRHAVASSEMLLVEGLEPAS
jgi:uncharacterized protein (DUF1330 family)